MVHAVTGLTSLSARNKTDMALLAIVQGGMYEDLRTECARELTALPFDDVRSTSGIVFTRSAETWGKVLA